MIKIAILIAALAFAVLNSQASAQVKYANTGVYEISFNKHGACSAFREIRLDLDDTGSNFTRAAFGFGAQNLDGNVVGLISIFDPETEMDKGQTATGTVSIDGKKYDTIFVADNSNLFSAYVEIDVIKQLAFGNKIKIETPALSYKMGLSGTLKAWAALQECIQDRIVGRTGAKVNPLGQTQPVKKPNPLGVNQ